MDSNRKKQAAAWYYQTLFHEERIPARKMPVTESVPEEIRAMRRLETEAAFSRLSREALFVRQGRLMERYEDEFFYERDVVRYFPTYQSLSDRELRGYFGWRTAWRRGERRKTSLSFAYLYVYELLNQIGVSDPMDGYEKLLAFEREYGALDPAIRSYLYTWRWDYVIYYQLDPVLLAGEPLSRFNRELMVLREMSTHRDEELMESVLALSSYRIDRSRLYLSEEESFKAAALRLLRAMDAYYAAHRKQTLAEDWFGALAVEPFEVFPSAVFFRDDRGRNSDYELDALTHYACRNGHWTVRQIDRPWGRSKKLGDVMRTLDAKLREALGVGNAIQPGTSVKWIVKLIDGAVADTLREKERREARRVTIDFSKLSGIREDASETREKLIVDEELDWELPAAAEPTPDPAPENRPEPALRELTNVPDGSAQEELPLDALERRYLRCLLYGEPVDWLRAEGVLPSVLADRINEKLFDCFGDNVLTTEERPEPVPDYLEELKERTEP